MKLQIKYLDVYQSKTNTNLLSLKLVGVNEQNQPIYVSKSVLGTPANIDLAVKYQEEQTILEDNSVEVVDLKFTNKEGVECLTGFSSINYSIFGFETQSLNDYLKSKLI